MFRIWFLFLLLVSLGFISAEAQIFDRGFQPPYYEDGEEPAESDSDNTRGPIFFKSSPDQDLNVSAVLPDYPWIKISEFRGFGNEKCLSCHRGIEEISHSHPMNFGCTVCHGGNGNATEKETAHSTLIFQLQPSGRKGNPSNLKIAEKSCGQIYCHEGHKREDRNIVSMVRKSLMGTLAGVISGLRYQWGGQANQIAKYGAHSIADLDGSIPKDWGALEKLSAFPLLRRSGNHIKLEMSLGGRSVSGHIGDRILRKQCVNCHLDSPGGEKAPRGTGCAACHVVYGSEGRYEGGDPTIRELSGSHPSFHKIVALPPNTTCAQCHLLYRHFLKEETVELQKKQDSLFPGIGQPVWDIHLEKGFDCIDCHTSEDIMGDGNIYSKQFQAVEIRCESCHGTETSPVEVEEVTEYSDAAVRRSRHYNGFYNVVGDQLAISAKGRKLTNVKVVEGKLVTFGKRSGMHFETPMTVDSRLAHDFPGHRGKLECSACHSQWVPRCRGCHSAFDQSLPNRQEKGLVDSPPVTWEKPVLMVGPSGKTAPMMARDPRPLTILDEEGKPVMALNVNGDSIGAYLERPFVNSKGYSGTNLAYAINPHSTGKRVRSCADCHLDPRTLGLGEGTLILGSDGRGSEDTLESTVLRNSNLLNSTEDSKLTPSGNRLAGINQPGARLFNKEELIRILRVGNCIACHDSYSDKIYKNMEESYSFEKTLSHRKLRMRILSEQ